MPGARRGLCPGVTSSHHRSSLVHNQCRVCAEAGGRGGGVQPARGRAVRSGCAGGGRAGREGQHHALHRAVAVRGGGRGAGCVRVNACVRGLRARARAKRLIAGARSAHALSGARCFLPTGRCPCLGPTPPRPPKTPTHPAPPVCSHVRLPPLLPSPAGTPWCAATLTRAPSRPRSCSRWARGRASCSRRCRCVFPGAHVVHLWLAALFCCCCCSLFHCYAALAPALRGIDATTLLSPRARCLRCATLT